MAGPPAPARAPVRSSSGGQRQRCSGAEAGRHTCQTPQLARARKVARERMLWPLYPRVLSGRVAGPARRSEHGCGSKRKAPCHEAQRRCGKRTAEAAPGRRHAERTTPAALPERRETGLAGPALRNPALSRVRSFVRFAPNGSADSAQTAVRGCKMTNSNGVGQLGARLWRFSAGRRAADTRGGLARGPERDRQPA